jgi:hypothetical protein
LRIAETDPDVTIEPNQGGLVVALTNHDIERTEVSKSVPLELSRIVPTETPLVYVDIGKAVLMEYHHDAHFVRKPVGPVQSQCPSTVRIDFLPISCLDVWIPCQNLVGFHP